MLQVPFKVVHFPVPNAAIFAVKGRYIGSKSTLIVSKCLLGLILLKRVD